MHDGNQWIPHYQLYAISIHAGALFHYVIVSMVVWWFFHLSFFFYEIMFPFHSHQMKNVGRLKYAAIVLIVLGKQFINPNMIFFALKPAHYTNNGTIYHSTGLFIPLPGVIVALSSHNHRYRLIRFPPDVCTTDDELWFYSTTLIFTVLIGTGVCLLIVIFWVVNKVAYTRVHYSCRYHHVKLYSSICNAKLFYYSTRPRVRD